ncbi:hypothetical protein BFW25_19335 [Aeromonas caviae]|nr:hypothetical protein BFW25_19335 [Aeromonas caviae]
MGAYWFSPASMASWVTRISSGSQGKLGAPWERLMLGWRAARSPITVKMVVPTWGSLLETWGMDMGPSPACVKEVPF